MIVRANRDELTRASSADTSTAPAARKESSCVIASDIADGSVVIFRESGVCENEKSETQFVAIGDSTINVTIPHRHSDQFLQ